METNLDQLYSLRKNFSVIGITGRTGSGCSDVAKVLSLPFSELDNIRTPSYFDPIKNVFGRKYSIAYNYTQHNWKKYKIIEYKAVLLFMMVKDIETETIEPHLNNYFVEDFRKDVDIEKIQLLASALKKIFKKHSLLIQQIQELGSIKDLSNPADLQALSGLFWGKEFKLMSNDVDKLLRTNGVFSRVRLLHHTASNYRKSGQPLETEVHSPEHIYTIAIVINRIIKATKHIDEFKHCHVVIDSLRNSLEINFFKERYSAFFLIAVKSDNRKARLLNKYSDHDNTEAVVNKLLSLDETEYECNDFQKGNFFAPDVQNCIQIADYHINYNTEDLTANRSNEIFLRRYNNSFFSMQEQLLKLQGLILQPGLITPHATERVMQMAFTARLNSGCISRQVGAVVTDDNFSTKAVGWNDIPKGAVPCSVRDIRDLVAEKSEFGFTNFELGKGIKETESISGSGDQELDEESIKFNQYLKEQYSSEKIPDNKLGGRNCSFCFKNAYNSFTGKENQVHTRSLHAEENAMLQISRYGGQGLQGGYLFTTASPCELCAKKAYQLGIQSIYYIDPYPGISRNHILKSNKEEDPKMVLFAGAVGNAYHKLYSPFMSKKDEIALLTELKLETPPNTKARAIQKMLDGKIDQKTKEVLNEKLKDREDPFSDFIEIVKKGLAEDTTNLEENTVK